MSSADEPSPTGSRTIAALDARETVFLRWLVGAGLGVIALLGGIVWNRVAIQIDVNTKLLSDHSMAIQRLDLDAASDRRASTAQLAAINAWLQAIGNRLNVSQPPPGAP